jgi:hypothetical protein
MGEISELRGSEGDLGSKIHRHFHIFLIIGSHEIMAIIRVPEFNAGVVADDEHLFSQVSISKEDFGYSNPPLFIQLGFKGIAIDPDSELAVVNLIGIEEFPIAIDEFVPVIGGIEMEAVFKSFRDYETVFCFFRQNPAEFKRDVQAVFAIQGIMKTADKVDFFIQSIHFELF